MEWNGFDFESTLPMDFAIANRFGKEAVTDTYERVFEEWWSDVRMMAEMELVLNWNIWALYRTDEDLAREYDRLWKLHRNWFWSCDHFSEEEQREYMEITD